MSWRQVWMAMNFARETLCPALWRVHWVLCFLLYSFLSPWRPLQTSLLQAKLPQFLHSLFPNHLSSPWLPKSMFLHMTNDVQIIIDFLGLSAPDLLSIAKGIEIECTVREKQINYNKWQINTLFFLSEVQTSGVGYIDKDFLDWWFLRNPQTRSQTLGGKGPRVARVERRANGSLSLQVLHSLCT